MPPKKGKTYGKKKAPLSSSSSIFAAPSPTPSRLIKQEATAIIEPNEEITILTPPSPQSSLPTFDNYSQEVVVDEIENESLMLSRLNLSDDSVVSKVEESIIEDLDFVDPALEPLNQLFSREQFEFCNSTWAELLPVGDTTVVKIAEASFAEVYRVEVPQGSSIVKIMPLMIPSDLDSYKRLNASKAEDVVPELQIMDELTEIPGFVKFKKAWLVKGKHSERFVKAWEKFELAAEEPSEFAHPASYGPSATFLAIELDDAGEVLENFLVDTWDKFWQIFLGVVQALATAEQVNEFEHRDLHENNICVLSKTANGSHELDITLIDYGLSRAKFKVKNTDAIVHGDDGEPEGKIAYKDLEEDLEIFQGPKELQFETYRQMRVNLYNGTTKKMPMKFHKDSKLMTEAGKSWEEFTPYSNVLWLSYIFQYLSDQYKESITTPGSNILSAALSASTEQASMDDMTKELKTLLSLTKLKPQGPFKSAGEVYLYCVDQGWLGEDGSIVGPLRSLHQEDLAALAALTPNETITVDKYPEDDVTKKIKSRSTRRRGKETDSTEEDQPIRARGPGQVLAEDIQTTRKYPLRGRGKKPDDTETVSEISNSTKGKKG